MSIVLRVVLIYIVLIVGLRILGKREFGDLSPLELLSLLLVPELVSNALQGSDYSVTNAIVGVATLFALTFSTSLLQHVSKRSQKMISGEPAVLVHRGRLLEDTLNRERVSADELFSEMFRAGVARLEDVEWAILDNDGRIAIVPVQHPAVSPRAESKAT